jgi:hypothetical protein
MFSFHKDCQKGIVWRAEIVSKPRPMMPDKPSLSRPVEVVVTDTGDGGEQGLLEWGKATHEVLDPRW